MDKEAVFSENFKRFRNKKGISQKDFACLLYKATGKQLTNASISSYETGVNLPPPQILPAIADILEVSIDALFGIGEAPSEDQAFVGRKQVLEQIEQDLVDWKATYGETVKEVTKPLLNCSERVLEIAKSQQKELVELQKELVVIRKVTSKLNGGS